MNIMLYLPAKLIYSLEIDLKSCLKRIIMSAAYSILSTIRLAEKVADCIKEIEDNMKFLDMI